ncbi:ER lumen protein-retaining receptor [Cryptosporidium felis]|nr:ER lumen protein-retaining receptor [Cryptosporidium felis]
MALKTLRDRRRKEIQRGRHSNGKFSILISGSNLSCVTEFLPLKITRRMLELNEPSGGYRGSPYIQEKLITAEKLIIENIIKNSRR